MREWSDQGGPRLASIILFALMLEISMKKKLRGIALLLNQFTGDPCVTGPQLGEGESR